MKKYALLILFITVTLSQITASTSFTLQKNWEFTKGDATGVMNINFPDAVRESLTVHHDWAIYGPFDKNIDKQVVAIVQNCENVATYITTPIVNSDYAKVQIKTSIVKHVDGLRLFTEIKVPCGKVIYKTSSKKRWDYMADIMEVNADNSPVNSPLEEVFYLA